MMIHMERRSGKDVPVIEKALVKLDERPFKALSHHRDKWAVGDHYRNPGPIQFEGPHADEINFTLHLEQNKSFVLA